MNKTSCTNSISHLFWFNFVFWNLLHDLPEFVIVVNPATSGHGVVGGVIGGVAGGVITLNNMLFKTCQYSWPG